MPWRVVPYVSLKWTDTTRESQGVIQQYRRIQQEKHITDNKTYFEYLFYGAKYIYITTRKDGMSEQYQCGC